MAHVARSSEVPPPGYIRVIGGLAVVIGAMLFIWLPYVGTPWIARAVGAATIVGGIGLISGRRWAWPFVVVTALPLFYVAVVFFLPRRYTDPFDLVHPWGVPFLIVGCLLLLASMTPSTRRWLKGGRPTGQRRRGVSS
jgi:uncharacterized membrane protein HdeD (DUF308 family)